MFRPPCKADLKSLYFKLPIGFSKLDSSIKASYGRTPLVSQSEGAYRARNDFKLVPAPQKLITSANRRCFDSILKLIQVTRIVDDAMMILTGYRSSHHVSEFSTDHPKNGERRRAVPFAKREDRIYFHSCGKNNNYLTPLVLTNHHHQGTNQPQNDHLLAERIQTSLGSEQLATERSVMPVPMQQLSQLSINIFVFPLHDDRVLLGDHQRRGNEFGDKSRIGTISVSPKDRALHLKFWTTAEQTKVGERNAERNLISVVG